MILLRPEFKKPGRVDSSEIHRFFNGWALAVLMDRRKKNSVECDSTVRDKNTDREVDAVSPSILRGPFIRERASHRLNEVSRAPDFPDRHVRRGMFDQRRY
jgi:hypothetical protein